MNASRDHAQSTGGPLPAANLEDLQDLLRRVEAATGADRELDEAIGVTFGYFQRHERAFGMAWFEPTGRSCQFGTLPLFTASLDAALALVERVLPGTVPPPREDMPLWLPKVARWFSGNWEATLYRSTDGFKSGASAPTPALALLAALLKALIAEQAAESTGERLAADSLDAERSTQPREAQ